MEFEVAKHHAIELSRMFRQTQAVVEAELAAYGIHPVSIAHGDPETHEETVLLFETVPELARMTGLLVSRLGGSDYSTFMFCGDGAEQAALEFRTQLLQIAPR